MGCSSSTHSCNCHCCLSILLQDTKVKSLTFHTCLWAAVWLVSWLAGGTITYSRQHSSELQHAQEWSWLICTKYFVNIICISYFMFPPGCNINDQHVSLNVYQTHLPGSTVKPSSPVPPPVAETRTCGVAPSLGTPRSLFGLGVPSALGLCHST